MRISALQNRYKLSMDYVRQKTELNGYPCELVIELTNRCNLNCIMCPREKMSRYIGDMDFHLFKKVIDEIKQKPTEMVDLCFAGESLLHPEVFSIIKYAKKSGLRTFIQTNATVLDENTGYKLMESGLDLLVLSIDAVREQTYRSIRPGGDFNEVTRNAETFLKIKNNNSKRAPYTIVQLVYLTYNKHEAKDFVGLWKSKGADAVRIKPFNDRAGFVDSSLDGRDDNNQNKGIPCIRLWRGLAIFWDGKVVPCCMDYSGKEIIGDVNLESILEIWNSVEIQNLRKLHIMNKVSDSELCRACCGYNGNLLKTLGTVFFDALSIRKLAPVWNRGN
ncbi:MAG: radical SAM protein [Elusimicrobiota bacterium]